MTELLKMIHSMKNLYDHLCSHVMKKYDMTRSELDILLFLYNNPSCDSAKDIVEKRGLIKSHASMGIDQLKQKGYLKVVQDQNDKRKNHLILLPKSHDVIQDGLAVQRRFNDILWKNMSQEDMKSFQNILHQMFENILEEDSLC